MLAAARTVSLAFLAWFLLRQFAVAGSPLSVEAAREIVNRVNLAEHGGWFTAGDVLAIIEIESRFDPAAYRYEPHLDDASIGLMQTLYSTALDRGLIGGPAALFDAETSIQMGMRQLAWSFQYLHGKLGRPPTEAEWIGSYNAGVGSILKGRHPVEYVRRWRAARGRYA